MKRPSQQDIIYYDLTIDHKPENIEHYLNMGSKTETNIRLLDPLIENPEEYMLSITKFKIDTESVPLMIAEMQQPQPVPSKTDYYNYLWTNYQVKYMNFNYYISYDGIKMFDQPITMVSTQTIKIPKPVYTTIDNTAYLGFNKDENNKIDKTKTCINNTHPQCFIYNYKAFILAIQQEI